MARAVANDYREKKDNILQRASALFAEEGFSRISMVQLAESCQISKSNLYHYYKDKEDILFSMLNEHMDEILFVLQKTVKNNEGNLLDNLLLAILESYSDAGYKHRLLLNDLKVLPKEKQEIIIQKEKIAVQFFKHAILLDFPEYMSQPKLLSVATMTLFGAINWSFTWFDPEKGINSTDYAHFVTGIFRAGLPHINLEKIDT